MNTKIRITERWSESSGMQYTSVCNPLISLPYEKSSCRPMEKIVKDEYCFIPPRIMEHYKSLWPGAISQGENLEELKVNISDAIQLMIAWIYEEAHELSM